MKPKKYPKKQSKFYPYKSGLEQAVFQAVPKKLQKKIVYEPAKLKYFLPKEYCPDFVINDKVYVEVKGYFRYEDQVKMKAVKQSNPFLDIRFLFATDNKVGGSKMLCSEWAIKYGFPYAFKTIPKGWFNE